jgi:hypothetical protein
MRRRRHCSRRSIILGIALFGACLPVPFASAGLPPPPVISCSEFTASPEFASDHTAFCGGHLVNPATGQTVGFKVYRTTDGGRTWATAAAAGLSSFGTDGRLTYLAVSPLFKTDQTLFAQVGDSGLFASTDSGESFLPVDPLGRGALSSYVMDAATPALPGLRQPASLLGQAGAHVVFMMAAAASQDGQPNQSALVDPLAHSHTTVRGTPGRDRLFAVSDTFSRDSSAFAVADTGIGLNAQVKVFRCDVTFACGQLLIAFPKRWTFDRIWLSRNFVSTRTVYASVTTTDGARTLWWSRDAGSTWSRWTSAERLYAPILALKKDIRGYAVGAGTGHTLFLRVAYSPETSSASAPPAEQFFRSADGGVNWTRVSYGRSRIQLGARGTMPQDNSLIDFADGNMSPGALTVASTRTIFALGGGSGSYGGFYCSWDGGVHWGRLCQ